ncbi:MAG TPA: hypothetical protein VK171_15170 [Fimbriimonas sp.]|nr:hypothetical protein [Fimbriimonas sp.]
MLAMLGLLVCSVTADGDADFPDVPAQHWAYRIGLPTTPVVQETPKERSELHLELVKAFHGQRLRKKH